VARSHVLLRKHVRERAGRGRALKFVVVLAVFLAGAAVSGSLLSPDGRTQGIRCTNPDGCLRNLPPHANLSPSAGTVNINESVQFDGSGSSDPNDDPLSFSWNFGDGSTGGDSATQDHAYGAPGTYTVTLSVSDGTAGDSATASITVINRNPVAAFSVGTSDLTARFDNGSSDPDGDPLTYAWNFGDGGTSTDASPSHTYANPGTYSVGLTVNDNHGGSAGTSQSVTVSRPNAAPQVGFGSSTNGLSANFTADVRDPDGDSISSYAWDFGDGQNGSGASTGHTYGSAGTYHVTLTATDSRGASGSGAADVTVTAPSTGGGGGGGGGGGENGNGGVVIAKPPPETQPKLPPPPPPPPPPPYGVISKASIKPLKGRALDLRVPAASGFEARFVFKIAPVKGARLKAVWFYNNKRIGEVGKPRARHITTFVKVRGALPKGYYRCDLMVRVPNGQWKTVKEVVARIG
jgi:PKD repeat protein